MATTGAALDRVRDQVNETLARFVERQRALATEIAGELLPAMDALADALTGGKRLRAAFCYWGWRGAGGNDSGEILTAASALELLHASALVHDDVLDGSDTRRGRPTVHRRFAAQHAAMGWHGPAGSFGTSVAILLGDLLLTWTDELYHSSGLPDAALRRGRPILDIMRTEVMAGQYLDLLEQASAGVTVAGALRVIRLPGSGQESHLPAPTDPDVNLSAHPARAVQSFGQYRSAQCANSRGASSLTSSSHSRALLPLRSSRLYFLCAQRIRWRSMRSQSGITLLG